MYLYNSCLLLSSELWLRLCGFFSFLFCCFFRLSCLRQPGDTFFHNLEVDLVSSDCRRGKRPATNILDGILELKVFVGLDSASCTPHHGVALHKNRELLLEVRSVSIGVVDEAVLKAFLLRIDCGVGPPRQNRRADFRLCHSCKWMHHR